MNGKPVLDRLGGTNSVLAKFMSKTKLLWLVRNIVVHKTFWITEPNPLLFHVAMSYDPIHKSIDFHLEVSSLSCPIIPIVKRPFFKLRTKCIHCQSVQLMFVPALSFILNSSSVPFYPSFFLSKQAKMF